MSTTQDDINELGDLMSDLESNKTEVPAGITIEEVQQYAKLDKAIKKAGPKHKELGNKIKAAYKKVGTFAVLNVIIKRTKAEKVDWKKFEDIHPVNAFPQFYKQQWVLDTDAVKASDEDLSPFTDVIERISIDTLNDPTE